LKKINYILYLLLILFVVSCKRNTDSSTTFVFGDEASDLPAILKDKELNVLFEYSPTSFYFYKGTNMGFEYEMLKAFSKEIGVKLKVEIIKDFNEAEHKIIYGDAQILACNYTITKERREKFDFTIPYLRTPQVLIQRMPWDSTPAYIKDPIQLTHKKIIVASNSSYVQRLAHLQEELGDTIFYQEANNKTTPEKLMRLVSEKKIDYTVVDNHIAVASAYEFKNLDHHLRLSVKQQIAFGLRKNTPLLRYKLNKWIKKFRKTPHYHFLKQKYYHGKELSELTYEDYLNAGGGKLSAYDKIFKREASKEQIEWQLVAAVVQQESNFKPYIKGKGGAFGLMQFMPSTGRRYGVNPESSPSTQIKAGTKKIKTDLKLWKEIPNPNQKIKFALATYNAGHAPIQKAQQKARLLGLDPLVWDGNVEKVLSKKRGRRVAHYVKQVYKRYATFKLMYE
jgi:membrane-bound lytic murein transglycosylase F